MIKDKLIGPAASSNPKLIRHFLNALQLSESFQLYNTVKLCFNALNNDEPNKKIGHKNREKVLEPNFKFPEDNRQKWLILPTNIRNKIMEEMLGTYDKNPNTPDSNKKKQLIQFKKIIIFNNELILFSYALFFYFDLLLAHFKLKTQKNL